MFLFLLEILVVLLHSFAAFCKPIYGLCTMIILQILFPVKFLGSEVSISVVCSSVLLLVYLCNLIEKEERIFVLRNSIEFSSVIVFVAFFIGIFFSAYVPVNQQIVIMLKFFNTHFLPIFLAIRIIDSKKKFVLFMNTYIAGLTLCCSYSVFCWIIGSSPWHEFIFSVGSNIDITNILKDNGTEVGIRISGTFNNSWEYTMILSVVFCFFAFFSQKVNWKSGKFLFALLMANVLLAARRTPFVTVSFFFIFLILFQKKNRFKTFAWVSVLIAVVIAAVYFIPVFSAYKGILMASLFFWNDDVAKNVSVGGSSLELRILQFIYVWGLVKGDILFGMGWGINQMHEEHPDQMAGWESSILQIFGQNGLFGFLLYAYMFYFMYKYSCHYAKDISYQKAYILAVSVMCIINGTFYWNFLFLGCVLMNMTNKYLAKGVKPAYA